MNFRARLVIYAIVAVIVGAAAYLFLSELWQDVTLTVYDQLAQPGKRGELIAKLEQKGPLGYRRQMNGYPVRFWSGLFNVVEVKTGAYGVAKVQVDFPSSMFGQARFNAEFLGGKYSKAATAPGRVFLWSSESPILVADIDHTIYGLNAVKPAQSQQEDDLTVAEAAEILTELNKTYYIVYLTACDDDRFNDTKVWLRENGFPDGPCFCRGFYPFQTQEGFKQQFVTDLKRRFPRTQIGVGDRESDAGAYLASGLQAFIIDPEKKRDLPKEAVRVDSWKGIAERLRGP